MAFLLELGFVLVLAAALGLLAHKTRQPLVLAYILTGVILGPAVLNSITSSEFLDTFARLGVAFLLFLVGISLKPSALKEMGRSAFVAGISQVALTFLFGFLLSVGLGFAVLPSLYLALALSFSSTIVVVKLLADRAELNSVSSRLAIGILLVQDVVALGALIVLNSAGAALTIPFLLSILAKTAVVAGIAIAVHRFIARRAFAFLSSSQELLLLTAVAWCVLMMGIAFAFGFSIEIGALLAGLALSSIQYTNDIEAKVRPLRDFFLIIFFIFLGTSISSVSLSLLVSAIVLSVFVLIGKPLLTLIVLGLLRYKKQTSFLASLSLGQVSEFSLIVAGLGLSLGQLAPDILSLLTLVALITITVSTYGIHHSQRLYGKLARHLTVFERNVVRGSASRLRQKYDIAILGCHTLGYSILQHLPSALVVDFNPSVVSWLEKKGVAVLFADVMEKETVRQLKQLKPKAIVSTIPGDNVALLRIFAGIPAKVILTAGSAEEAERLYKKGADLVLVPHHLGGRHAATAIKEFLANPQALKARKASHREDIHGLLHFLKGLRP